jgi:hypothetical protein
MASIGFHVMVRVARWRRARYASCLDRMARPVAGPGHEVPATLVSFCGRRDFPELVASWRSFQRWIGRPARACLVSDGTLDERERDWIRRLEPRVEIVTLEQFGGRHASARMRAYAKANPMGNKLFVMRALGEVAPCIYSDSDILFFPASREIGGREFWEGDTPSYLLDPYPSLDVRLIKTAAEREQPVNGGFVVLRSAIDWTAVMARFEAMTEEPAFFSEQTLAHLAIRSQGGRPLDPGKYVLRNEDQWAATDWFSGPGVALRHYISSLRHKMWIKMRVFA